MRSKKYLFIIIPLLLLVALAIIFLLWNKEYTKTITINIGDEVPISIKYDNKNFNVSWDNMITEDGKIYHTGIYAGNFKYFFKTYKVNLIVEDNEKPTLLNVSDITVFLNEDIDFYSHLSKEDPNLGKLVGTSTKGYAIYLKNDCYYIDGIIIAN